MALSLCRGAAPARGAEPVQRQPVAAAANTRWLPPSCADTTRPARRGQVLSTRKRKDVDEKNITVNVCLFAFDCLYLDGR